MKKLLSKILLLCLCLFTACAGEEEEMAMHYGDPVKVCFKLAAADPAHQSRGNTGQYVAEVDEDESNAFHVTFKTYGDIAFYPTIHKYYDDTENFDLSNARVVSKSVRVTDLVGNEITTPGGIFEKLPHFDSVTGELLARLADVEGSAIVELTTEFTLGGSLPNKVMTRKIYVTLKKTA